MNVRTHLLHPLSLFATVLLAGFLGFAEPAGAGCGASCGGSAWQKQYGNPAAAAGGGPATIRAVGFGVALTDPPVVCQPSDPNPATDRASAVWQDFRFYVDLPGLGIARGSLHPDRTSSIDLAANTPSGLFPARFVNHLFLRITPLAFPGLVYENTYAVDTLIDSVNQAPPDATSVGYQVTPEDVFELAVPATGLPVGIPTRLAFTGGVHTFLTPGGLPLDLVAADASGLSFRLTNPFPEEVVLAYFVHGAGTTSVDPGLDGVVTLAAEADQVVAVSLASSPSASAEPIVVDVVVLRPVSREGFNRIQVNPATSGTGGQR